MYKSPVFNTFIFKYIHPAIMLLGGSIGMYFLWQEEFQHGDGFVKAFTVAFLWLAIFIVQIPFRLKMVKADIDGVTIGSGKTGKLVKYEYIEYVTHFDFWTPWFSTLKYKDAQTNLSKKVAFIANAKNQIAFKENAMTRYIKDNMKLHVPHYDESMHPSAWKNLLINFILGLPVLALMIYFLKDHFV